MTITINLSPELEQQLRETSAARGIPAEEFVVGALSQSLQQARPARLPAQLSEAESRLLAVINQGLSQEEWQRYRALIDRRRAETLTVAEHQELIAISDRLELLNAARIEKLAELARLRGVTLDQVMDQLGIRRPAYE